MCRDQFLERLGWPVPIGSPRSSRLVDFPQDLFCTEPLRPTGFFLRLLASAAVIKTVPFQNSNRAHRVGGQIG